jgi:hypothetical protein
MVCLTASAAAKAPGVEFNLDGLNGFIMYMSSENTCIGESTQKYSLTTRRESVAKPRLEGHHVLVIEKLFG